MNPAVYGMPLLGQDNRRVYHPYLDLGGWDVVPANGSVITTYPVYNTGHQGGHATAGQTFYPSNDFSRVSQLDNSQPFGFSHSQPFGFSHPGTGYISYDHVGYPGWTQGGNSPSVELGTLHDSSPSASHVTQNLQWVDAGSVGGQDNPEGSKAGSKQ